MVRPKSALQCFFGDVTRSGLAPRNRALRTFMGVAPPSVRLGVRYINQMPPKRASARGLLKEGTQPRSPPNM